MSHLGTTLYARSWHSLVPTHFVPGKGVGIIDVPTCAKVRASRMVPIGRLPAMNSGLGDRGGVRGVASRCSLNRLGGMSLARCGVAAANVDELLDVGGRRGHGAMENNGGRGPAISPSTVWSAGMGAATVVHT